MRIKIKKIVLVGLMLSLGPMAANADLIDIGDSTVDSSSELEWLDVILTVGLSYNGVLASSYVVDAGYRFATEAEVFGLMESAGGTPSTATTGTVGNVAPARLLLDLMGCTSFLASAPCDGEDQDWLKALWGASSQYIALVDVWDRGEGDILGYLSTQHFTEWTLGDVSPGPDVGAFLVRSTTVPEPSTLALLGLGLAGMGLARRKKV